MNLGRANINSTGSKERGCGGSAMSPTLYRGAYRFLTARLRPTAPGRFAALSLRTYEPRSSC